MTLSKDQVILTDIAAGVGLAISGVTICLMCLTGDAKKFCLLACISILIITIALSARVFMSSMLVSHKSTALHVGALLAASFDAGLMAAHQVFWPLALYSMFIAITWGLNAQINVGRR